MFLTAAIKRVAFASAVTFSAITTAQSTGTGSCTDVHIFLSRGNNEPYPGRQSKLVDGICSGLSSCDYEDIAFDNALKTEYCSAVEAGRIAGTDQITAYNKKCPDAKLVVSGYSQGAQVVGDILGGGGGTFFQGCTIETSSGLDPNSAPGNMIGAALLFGDTRHTADQSYNFLDGSSYNGLFPRTGDLLTGLNKFAGVLRSWCQGKDPICATGDGNRDTDVADHLNYFDIYPDSAGTWVRSILGETSTASSTSGSTTTATSTKGQSSSTEAATTSSVSTSDSGSSTTTSGNSNTSETGTAPETTSTSGISNTSGSSASSGANSTSGSSTTSGTVATTTLPEATATDSGASASPTATSSNQEGGAGVVRCYKSLVSLVALGSLMFLIA
ncbi:carbohydrate esterase family 5 protein [Whalleya microplaca]|nr:carbohydrate esterase family 5 protein [Whalleya microplaca]